VTLEYLEIVEYGGWLLRSMFYIPACGAVLELRSSY